MRSVLFPKCLFILTSLAASGCSRTGPEVVEVHGTVTYGGQPVSVGTINFAPTSANGPLRPAIGTLASDGTYELRAFPDRDGALAGEYLVSVNAYTGSIFEGTAKYVVPRRFANPQTSGLKAVVPSGVEPVTLNFDLMNLE